MKRNTLSLTTCTKIWDVIIVGAGPAGCAAAYDLARAGLKVLLVDRANFPRQKACAGGLTPAAIQALRYSVEPVIQRSFSSIRVERHLADSTIARRRSAYCFMTVREEFDSFCLERTLSAGAEFKRISSIERISQNESSTEMVIDNQLYQSRFVVGADGVHSRVRQLTDPNPSWYSSAFALEAIVSCESPQNQDLVFDVRPVQGGYGWVFPKGDHLNIGLYSHLAEERIDRARLSAYIRSLNIGTIPDRIVGQYLGFGAANHVIAATRVFLVGDAGGFVNPITAEGIGPAITSGQSAAAAIESELKGRGPAHKYFARNTKSVRRQLMASTSATKWFYAHPSWGIRFLSTQGVMPAVLGVISFGRSLSTLLLRVTNASTEL